MTPARSGRLRYSQAANRDERASDHLRFIRDTMERASSFTAVSGWGQAAVGVIGFAGAIVAAAQPTDERWLAAWLAAAGIAVLVDALAIRHKAARLGLSLSSAPARRFALTFTPPLVAGACLSWVLAGAGLHDRLAGTWLLLFGTGVATGGAYSVKVVPLMGVAFMALGMLALAAPAGRGDAYMALGFGGLNLLFGVFIALRHGG